MASMKAITIDRYGGPEVMQLRDIAIPEPGPGEVLVKVAHHARLLGAHGREVGRVEVDHHRARAEQLAERAAGRGQVRSRVARLEHGRG